MGSKLKNKQFLVFKKPMGSTHIPHYLQKKKKKKKHSKKHKITLDDNFKRERLGDPLVMDNREDEHGGLIACRSSIIC